MVGWCSGAISGLVAATPASGYITPWASVALGVVTGVLANFGTKVKYWIRIDDSMDVFAEHGIAGMIGLFFNGIFGAEYIIGLDGVNVGTIPGGWIERNWKQLYIQVAYIAAATAYAFVMSAIIALIINYIPGLHLRASEEAELLGMDDDQLGEFAWTPTKQDPEKKEYDIPQGDRHGIQEHSEMLEGKEPSEESKSGDEHTVIQGDRHALPYEKAEGGHSGIGGDRHAVPYEKTEREQDREGHTQ